MDKIEYKKITSCAACFCKSAIELCEWLNAEYDGNENKDDINRRLQRVLEIQSHFFEAKEQYILSREQKISKALLGHLSLSDVKKMYWNLSK